MAISDLSTGLSYDVDGNPIDPDDWMKQRFPQTAQGAPSPLGYSLTSSPYNSVYAAAAAANPPQGGPYVGSGAPAPQGHARPFNPMDWLVSPAEAAEPQMGKPPFPRLINPPGATPPQGDATTGAPPFPGPVLNAPVQGPSILPQARGAGGAPYTGSSILPQARGVAVPPDPTTPQATINPDTDKSPLVRTARSPSGRPATPNLGYYPPPPSSAFGLIDRQNASAQQGQPGRGYQTALDLSHLFGGGQPGAVNPANVPAPNAQPVSGRGAGPLAGAPMPPLMPDDIRRLRAQQLAAASLKQRYG